MHRKNNTTKQAQSNPHVFSTSKSLSQFANCSLFCSDMFRCTVSRCSVNPFLENKTHTKHKPKTQLPILIFHCIVQPTGSLVVLALTPVLQCPADDTDFSVQGCSETALPATFLEATSSCTRKKERKAESTDTPAGSLCGFCGRPCSLRVCLNSSEMS